MANPWQNALTQLRSIMKYIDFDQSILDKLMTHEAIHKQTLEVTLDDGSKVKLPAFRAQHNSALGPYKGGVRFHPGVTEDEVKALSMWMT